ncbi:hypothetical protein C4D60_Mb09t05440 [Musa balbisiana]|uniref:Uncharacterized protein n=1 Tax=Musa balbisiana TaxID=52838 RepID=A0A4S8IFJ5_MUSBA|nr:hypothetical protein C4D60_Mb09t05440 [Musa balbisiana]
MWPTSRVVLPVPCPARAQLGCLVHSAGTLAPYGDGTHTRASTPFRHGGGKKAVPCLGPDSRAALLFPKTVGDGPSGKSPESAKRSKPREPFATFMTAKAYDPVEGRKRKREQFSLVDYSRAFAGIDSRWSWRLGIICGYIFLPPSLRDPNTAS